MPLDSMLQQKLKLLLNSKVDFYNQPSFIKADPICIPHLFSKKQDIEIAGFFAAVFAWGNRTTIINKSKELLQLMDNAPHQFCLHHSDNDLKKIIHFKHRTFNATDLLYFIQFLKFHFANHQSLEVAFTKNLKKTDATIENGLIGFYNYFFSLPEYAERTKKHIATPLKNSTCKRLCMYLRWMVRNDDKGVDFGLWKNIQPNQLIIPIDVHVARVASQLNILQTLPNQPKALGWHTAIALTNYLKKMDKQDPVKYDFALFGMGAIQLL
jgi:uncharacterized protein (TIGR02757 family)